MPASRPFDGIRGKGMIDYGALPDFSVQGMHVLITGGTGGIGGAARVMARLPIKRRADPMELSGTAPFLASPAGRLVNGVTSPVDGGYGATSWRSHPVRRWEGRRAKETEIPTGPSP